MVAGRYQNWAATKIRSSSTQSSNLSLEFGDAYVFGYQPDKTEIRAGFIKTQDLLPLFVVTHAYRGSMHGINIIGIPNKSAKIRMIEMLSRAQSEDTTGRVRAIYDIRRLTDNSSDFRSAKVAYKWKNIKTRIAKLDTPDLEELSKRIL